MTKSSSATELRKEKEIETFSRNQDSLVQKSSSRLTQTEIELMMKTGRKTIQMAMHRFSKK